MYATTENGLELDVLYRDHHLAVKKLSLSYCDYNNELAEEAVQHSYLVYMESINAGIVIDKPRTYLMTVAKNYTLTQLKKYRNEHPYENIVEYSDQVRYGNDVESEYFEELSRQKLNEALEVIKKKNDTWYFIIVEVYLKGKSQVEIAEELNLTKEAVYALVYRIKEWTKNNMMDYRE